MHPDAGTANVLFRLDNTYIELLAASGSGWLADAVEEHLRRQGEGPFALALGSSDATATARALADAGLDAGPVFEGEGRDATGTRQRRWKICPVPSSATRGIGLFVVQHLSAPDALPFAEATVEAESTAGGVDHFVVMTGDPGAALSLYGDKLGLRLALDRSFPDRGVRLLFFRLGGITLECAAPLTAEGDRPDRFWGISYRVADIDRARSRLAAAGFDVSEVRKGQKPGTRVCTVRRETHGVATLLDRPRVRARRGEVHGNCPVATHRSIRLRPFTSSRPPSTN